MPPLEKIGLEAILDTTEFTKGQRIYERGLDHINASTAKTAKSLTSAWDDSTAGLEDMFASLDAMKGGADDVATGLAAIGTEATAVSASMVAAGVATAGVAIALAAVAAVGVAIWNKIDDAAIEYLARSKEVIKAQEKVNDEWDQASRHLAQSLIPLKVELLEVELKLAEAVAKTADFVKNLVAQTHVGFARIIEGLKTIPEAIERAFAGDPMSVEELWERMKAGGVETAKKYLDAFEETFEEAEEIAEDNWDKIADAVNSALDRIEDMQIAHNRRLADLADDNRIKQERAWAKYEISVAKEINKGQARIAKLEERYNKRRIKTIATFQKRIAKAEAKVSEARVKAAEDFDRRERHARERFQLDNIQSERRYQFERNRLVAEGDTLAIEQLDARYKLEQEEAKENEALRQRQAGESQTEQIREAGEAAREQIDELRQQLAEALDEQETNYLDQVEAQKKANLDRIDEMAASFDEQRRLADEDYQGSIEKANLNYERQQEDLGRNLARQEELQELGAEQVDRLLDRHYGEDGVADRIMEGWHERENTRILVTAALLEQLATGTKWGPLMPGGAPMPGQEVGMDQGGVIVGPQTVQVGAGVVEAFIPLSGGGAGGGAFTHEFTNALNITGLEGASSTDMSRIARELAESLTQKIRTKRRN